MVGYYYIFDMDGTLFFTNELNNESYNYALIENKLQPIGSHHKRITRKVVMSCYPAMTDKVLFELIRQKQEYFVKNIRKIQVNAFLFDILKKAEKEKCALWTSAEKTRVDGIIGTFDIKCLFNKIIFSNKKHISEDISHFCSEFTCTKEQLIVFENDIAVANELQKNNVSCYLLICP